VLLVKTGLLLVALAVGWLVRARVRARAGVELVLVAGILVAVSVLVLLRPARNVVAAPAVQAAQPSPAPPVPPAAAVVLARELGPLGVAIEAEPKRLTAIVLSPAGGGLSGLDVRIDDKGTSSCGAGCYRVDARARGRVAVEIGGYGRTTFAVPEHAPPADALVRRLQRDFRALRSVTFREHLASDPKHAITALWRLERPNRVEYRIPGGAQGIVIGGRRWDRPSPSARWQPSPQTPLTQPATQWSYATNAHVLADDGDTRTVSFADPTVPAYFILIYDARTFRPIVLHMTAAAHFMTDRYLQFNAARAIRPPR
jgi:hypothetical protein